jgi:hypothetical protein
MYDKENVAYLCNGIWFSLKKIRKVNPVIFNSMDESGRHVKWNKSGTEKQIQHDLSYIWNLKNQTHRNRVTEDY